MSSTPVEAGSRAADPYDFSVILGGPLFQLYPRAPICPATRWSCCVRRVIVDFALRVAPAVDPVDAGRARVG